MTFTLPLVRGLKSAWHHMGLVFLLYLAALGGSLSAAFVAFARYADVTGASPFAQRAFADGNMFAILDDFSRGHAGDLQALETLLPIFVVMTAIVHVLFAAGLAETLLEREAKREHPFLLGIGRHSWRFLRSAIWFLLMVVLVGFGIATLFGIFVVEVGTQQASSAFQVWAGVGIGLLAALLFAFLDLGYDLSRIAAAAHDEGRTFVGYFKGLGHALRHPLRLLPLWFFYSLVVVGLHLALTAFRNGWQPTSTAEVLGLIAIQQVVFFVAAFFRVGLWGAEVAYYQAIGEPRWCGRKRHAVPSSTPSPVEATAPAPVTVHRQPLPVDDDPVPALDRPEPEPLTTPEPIRPSWDRPIDDEEDDDGDGTGPRTI
ncbi:MAG TPA: hypothetical protein VKU40_13690 [Thermoanaerobaculia bacterium]|nr:hypothetical protein [Thermoanaerobaculia bacterium]